MLSADQAQGSIKWFTAEKRFGFIDPDEGHELLFMHESFLDTLDPQDLRIGMRVEYEPVDGDKGREARRVRASKVEKANGFEANDLKSRSGFSVCTFNPNTKALIAKGWFLGPQVEKVEIFRGKDDLIGQAKIGLARKDVHQKYPEYSNPNCGWRLELRLEEVPADQSEINAVIHAGGSVIQSLQKNLTVSSPDDEARLALERLPNTARFAPKPKISIEPIVAEFRRRDLPVQEAIVDFGEYETWYAKTDYPANYPKYVKEFPVGGTLNQKAMQHYLSIDLLGLKAGDVYMDIASSNSVFPDIALRQVGVARAYRQDLSYAKGVHGDRVGGDAADIPLPDASLNHMALHCSWEHFEGTSDIGLLQESARVLKKGGRICVIPLYMANEFLIQTSLCMWRRGAELDVPGLDPEATLYVQEGLRQRCMRSYSPQMLKEKIFAAVPDSLRLEIHHFKNWEDHAGCPVFALIGERV